MRAQQTAAPAARQLELEIVTSAALREQHFGIVEGMRADEIQSLHPRAWEDWLQFREDHAMPEGESARQFHARIIEALGRIAAAHAGQNVLVVTHGGVLDMVWRTARGLGLNGPRQSEIPNAGFNRIRIADAAAPDADRDRRLGRHAAPGRPAAAAHLRPEPPSQEVMSARCCRCIRCAEEPAATAARTTSAAGPAARS